MLRFSLKMMGSTLISGWCLGVPNLPRFDDTQLKQARSLIRKHCCNFQNGDCCALDDGIDPRCVQWNSYSLQCTWFQQSVLPLAPKLQEIVLRRTSQYKQCILCKRHFSPSGNRAIYCPKCSQNQQRKRTYERVRRYRAKV